MATSGPVYEEVEEQIGEITSEANPSYAVVQGKPQGHARLDEVKVLYSFLREQITVGQNRGFLLPPANISSLQTLAPHLDTTG